MLRSTRRALLQAAIIGLVTFVLFALVEGIASMVVVSRGQPDVLLERSHTEYDAELGWINERNVRVDDLYGPGLYLQTNSQRFRNSHDFPQNVPPGKIRVLCTGDSFTLGYGVKNDDAWCQLLASKDARFETVNMGQGGYGIDQAYLWYRRDGLTLKHDALVFAFTSADFIRMMSASFSGYPKPVLAVRDGMPVVAEPPGSRWAFLAPWLRQRLGHLSELRILKLVRSEPADGAVWDLRMDDEQARKLTLAILRHLKKIHAERGTSVLVALLPMLDDHQGSGADAWRAFLRDELARLEIPFLDLIEALRKQPPVLVPRLFRGHYSELGNQWAADAVYDALVGQPRVQERLAALGPAPRPTAPLLKLAALEPVPLSGARITASSMADLAALAIDGVPDTRWHSGAPQQGDEWLLVELDKPVRVAQVTLHLGDAQYDQGRILAVDTAEKQDDYVEVLRLPADQALVPSANASGATQVLPLPQPKLARYIRIRQVGRANDNFWSVFEIELFAHK